MINKFNRFEFKYLMSARKAENVLNELRKCGMDFDSKSYAENDNSYIVNSVYFDSWDWKDYQDKVGGFMSRKKIRTRFYKDKFCRCVADEAWLEIKRKENMVVLKSRSKFKTNQFDNFKKTILQYNDDFLKKDEQADSKDLFLRVLKNVYQEGFHPRVLVRYKRKPLVFGSSNNLRITFDTNIEACKTSDLTYNKPMTPVKGGVIVMELKYNHCVPFWVGSVIKKFNLQRVAFSKYAYSVEAVNKYKPLSK